MQMWSRRAIIKVFGLGTASAIVAACQPKTVEVTRVVEKEVEKVVNQTVVVKEAVEVEKEVTRVVVEKQQADPAKPAPKVAGELVFWGHDEHPLDYIGAGFERNYPDVKWVSPKPADRVQKFKACLAAGGGCPDLFWAEATDAQDWGCNEMLTDLTEELLPYIDQYHPLKVNETFVAKTGKNVGWPGDISVSGYFYRPDLYAEAGYPDVDWDNLTYDDFCLMSADILKQGKYTFQFPGDGWNTGYMWVLHQMGGTAVSGDGQEIMVTSDESIAAMEIVKKLWDCGGGLDVGFWSAPYWAALQEGTMIGAFAAAWNRGFMEAQLKTPEAGAGKWRCAPLPTGPGIKNRSGVWGGAQVVSPKTAPNRDAAIEYMKYGFATLEGAALAEGAGSVPSWQPFLKSELFLGKRTPLFGDWPYNEFWAKQEQELSSEYYRPAGWGAVNTIVNREMVAIMLDEVGVEEGMDRILELATPDFERTKCSF